jgi:hypothetical protein
MTNMRDIRNPYAPPAAVVATGIGIGLVLIVNTGIAAATVP